MTNAKGESRNVIYETVEAINGNMITRVKSSIFYSIGLFVLLIGITLLFFDGMLGVALIFITFLTPCFLLYPAVRFLFGGKDSVAAVAGTLILEEIVKHKILKKLDSKKDRRK